MAQVDDKRSEGAAIDRAALIAKAGTELDALRRALDGRGIPYRLVPYDNEPPTVAFELGDCSYHVFPSNEIPGMIFVSTTTSVFAKTSADVLELCGLMAKREEAVGHGDE